MLENIICRNFLLKKICSREETSSYSGVKLKNYLGITCGGYLVSRKAFSRARLIRWPFTRSGLIHRPLQRRELISWSKGS